MRHARDVIRLRSAGMPTLEIARRLGMAPSTVRLTIRRFEAAGLSWLCPAASLILSWRLGCSPVREPVPVSGGAIADKPRRTGRRCTASSGAST
jgi:hypothetical protein